MEEFNTPEDMEKLHKALWNEFGVLHLKWLLFSQLYEDETTVNLLNESAPTFFGVCQTVFLDDIILVISRLTDPSHTKNKENLTLERLAAAIDSANFPELKDEIDEALNLVRSNCNFARTNRNRRIAHTDLKTYFQEHPESLPSVTKEKIEEALLTVREVMNKFELHFSQNETGYEYLVLPDGANSLIGCLYDAKSYREQAFS